jgi:hypothetical protein
MMVAIFSREEVSIMRAALETFLDIEENNDLAPVDYLGAIRRLVRKVGGTPIGEEGA